MEKQKESLQLRLIEGLGHVKEAEFWPCEIVSTVNTLTSPITFKEFNEFLSNQNSAAVNNIHAKISLYRAEYDSYISDLSKMENVFSFDTDYI